MPVSLDDLLRAAGITTDPTATRPRRVAAPVVDPSQGMRGELGDAPVATSRGPMGGDAPDLGENAVPPGWHPPMAADYVPSAPAPPPRSFPTINPTDEAPPSADTRTRFADPNTDAQQTTRVAASAPFGSSGEPFGSSRQRYTQPRDHVQELIDNARDHEAHPSSKLANIASGILQGVAALDGHAPRTPVDVSGKTRELDSIYSRLGQELGISKEQAQIKAIGNQYGYRQQQGMLAQERAMIQHYNASKEYTKGANPPVDQMYASAGLTFPNKGPKTQGAKYHPPIYLSSGQAVQYNDATGEYEDARYNGTAMDPNAARANVVATGADGQQYSVLPNQALGAAATAAGQQGTADRAQAALNQSEGHFRTTQQQHQQELADKSYNEWVTENSGADSDESAARQLEQQQGANGYLSSNDVRDLRGFKDRAALRRTHAHALAQVIARSHGDFYDVGPDGVPKPKTVQPPAAATTAPSSSPSTTRPQVDHTRFEKDYAAAKTPEEKARIMKLYQAAIKAAGQ